MGSITVRYPPSAQFGAIVLTPGGLSDLQTKGGALLTKISPIMPSYWTFYRNWSGSFQFPQTPGEGWAQSKGAAAVIAWEPNLTCAQIVDGTHDTYIDASAAKAIAYHDPIYLRFAYEFNGNWEPYGVQGQPAGNSYAQFVTAWQYVWNRWNTAGVANVKWIWNPNVDGGTRPFSACYPGDAYVDIVSLDGYNQDLPWQHPTDVFESSLVTLEGVTTSKPIWITEIGSAPTNGANTKAQWFTDMGPYLATHPRITAVHYFDDVGPNGDMTVDSSGADSAALTAFNSALQAAPFR